MNENHPIIVLIQGILTPSEYLQPIANQNSIQIKLTIQMLSFTYKYLMKKLDIISTYLLLTDQAINTVKLIQDFIWISISIKNNFFKFQFSIKIQTHQNNINQINNGRLIQIIYHI
ncbi:unnamed protein product [Paramecium octaurelia]|uniref:Uncharacterized protein n=1 Tax=Paramecium octaurelia TaxID=43137 RepID=A0A8S1YKR3_PAROT|nr:unnamed protein product [Paramecium octaurelia]